jgi:ubiquinone/menaquinone biosynthesis C-methylase UbiE
MNKYHDVIYGNYPKSTYPEKLADKLAKGYFRPDSEILELGCGDGTYVKAWSKMGFKTWGLDRNRSLLGGISMESPDIDFNSDGLPYLAEQFNIIFCKSLLEHISDTDWFLSEIERVLKPGGKAIFLLPAWEYNYKDFYNDYTHVKPFHRKGLQDALKIHGFKDVRVEYFYHLPWLWGRPYLLPLVLFLRLFSRWKWKNREENIHRPNIRFSQEVQLLAVAEK